MGNKYHTFVKKAAKIIATEPCFCSENEKIAALNRRFRLDKNEAKLLLREISKK